MTEETVVAEQKKYACSSLPTCNVEFIKRLENLYQYLLERTGSNGLCDKMKRLILNPGDLLELVLDRYTTDEDIKEFAGYIAGNPLIISSAQKMLFNIAANGQYEREYESKVDLGDVVREAKGYKVYKIFHSCMGNDEFFIWSKENPANMIAYIHFELERIAFHDQVDVIPDALAMTNALIKLYDCHIANATDAIDVNIHDVREERAINGFYQEFVLRPSVYTKDRYQILSAFGIHLSNAAK